ncbi:MAG: AAA family ATPase [Ardenticatenaceae bacterium]|nr:AAA family ATPase [Ardenticatenaceae bacterium]
MKLICFGTFAAWEGTQELAFRSDKIRALLAYLALNANQPHRRDSLAALFWGELPDEKAKTNLRLSLSRLGQSLADVPNQELLSDRQTVQLNLVVEAHWLDVRLFELHLAACAPTPMAEWWRDAHCVSHLQTAVALYTAPFLAGLHVDGAAEFDAWRLWQAESYHQQALAALQALTHHALALHHFQTAQYHARQQLRLEPWRETAHRQLMQALAAAGQTDAALRQYEQCRRILAEEFAVTPDAQTEALAAEIRRGHVYQAAAAAERIPTAVTRFWGRQTALERIGRLLLDPHSRLITLTGLGGIGKTRLAREAAHRYQHLFDNGLWFVPLADVADSVPNNPAAVETGLIEAITRAGNVQLHERTPLKQQLWQALEGQNVLLVLDNFEHLLAATTFVADMLAQLPQMKLLVTSRSRLQLQAETVMALAGLSLPPLAKSSPQQLMQSTAVNLFVERARRLDNAFDLTAESAADIALICTHLEGNPLGIELAAAWVSSLSVRQIAAAMQADMDMLTTTMVDVPQRQRSMRAAFAGSWRLLRPEAQNLLVGLSLFRGSFEPTAVTHILTAVPAELAHLVRFSLLEHGADGRYRMHTLLLHFAAEKRSLWPQHEVEVQYVAYYLDYVCGWETAVNGDDLQMGLQAIEREWDNVQQACRQAIVTAQWPKLTQASPTLYWYFRFRGLTEPGQVLFTELITQLRRQLPDGQPPDAAQAQLLAELLLGQARLMWFTDKPAAIEAAGQQLLAMAADYGLDEMVAPAHLIMAGAGVLDGRYAASLEHATIGYAQAQAQNQELWQIEGASRLAYLAMLNGKLDEARTYATEAWQLSQKRGMRESELAAHLMLANLAYLEGRLEAARKAFEEAQYLNQRRGNPLYWAAEINDRLAKVLIVLGHYDLALPLIQQAVSDFQKLGAAGRSMTSRITLGVMYGRLGHYAEAESIYQTILTWPEQTDTMSHSITLMNLSEICRQQDRIEEAVMYARQALKQVEASGATRYLAAAQQILGEALLVQGELAEAKVNLEQALLFYENGRPQQTVGIQASLAWLALAQGNLPAAVQQVETILDFMTTESLDEVENGLEIYWKCFKILQQAQDEGAEALIQTAYAHLRRQANRIQNEQLRQSYLEAVVVHQKIQTYSAPKM